VTCPTFTEACHTGRRPAGFAGARRRAGSVAGEYFAVCAELEAASVYAFRALADELRAHAAPRGLRRRAVASARDEVRHARVMGTLARRAGCAPREVAVEPRATRGLEEVARENAVEGCVRETFGALVATWQARTAKDARVRAAMERIAADETRHAALAWDVKRWADARLPAAARRRVARAMARELGALERAVASEAPAGWRAAGHPSAREAQAMMASLRAALWAAP
jgi:hypothetical protein